MGPKSAEMYIFACKIAKSFLGQRLQIPNCGDTPSPNPYLSVHSAYAPCLRPLHRSPTKKLDWRHCLIV